MSVHLALMRCCQLPAAARRMRELEQEYGETVDYCGRSEYAWGLPPDLGS